MFEIAELKQIRALASPIRQEILDTLETSGPCTVAELAQILGLPADGLYYHVRLLSRRRLVIETNRRGMSGRLEAVIDLPGRPTRLRYAARQRGNAVAVGNVVASMLRSALRSFRRAFTAEAVVDGPQRSLWAARRTAWLTTEDLEAVNQLLQELLGRIEAGRRGRQGARLHALTFVLSPHGPARTKPGPVASLTRRRTAGSSAQMPATDPR